MSNLEFFCNRPTLVSLIEFGSNLNMVKSGLSSTSEVDSPSSVSSEDKGKTGEDGRAFVKGLLGYGKGRVVFYLNTDIDSVSVYLNKEDGSQLAMLVQERFQLDLKVRTIQLVYLFVFIFLSLPTLYEFKLFIFSFFLIHCHITMCFVYCFLLYGNCLIELTN